MKKISIVIVSYKSDSVLKDCLLSIQNFADIAYSDFEVVIVDNYSESQLSILIKEIEVNVDYHIKYVKNKINGGFGQGNNVGVAHATGEVILFLNPDIILVEGVLRETYLRIKADKTTIMGYSLIDVNYNQNNSYSYFPEMFYMSFLIFFIKRYAFLLPNKLSFVNKRIWPWGAAFALRRDVFVEAGAFDEKIFLCNEEADLLKRISHRNVFISNKRIIHLEGHTTVSSVERHTEFFRSTFYYLNKYKFGMDTYVNRLLMLNKLKLFLGKKDDDFVNKKQALENIMYEN